MKTSKDNSKVKGGRPDSIYKEGELVDTVVGPMRIECHHSIRTEYGISYNVWRCTALNKNGTENKRKIKRFFADNRLFSLTPKVQ